MVDSRGFLLGAQLTTNEVISALRMPGARGTPTATIGSKMAATLETRPTGCHDDIVFGRMLYMPVISAMAL